MLLHMTTDEPPTDDSRGKAPLDLSDHYALCDLRTGGTTGMCTCDCLTPAQRAQDYKAQPDLGLHVPRSNSQILVLSSNHEDGNPRSQDPDRIAQADIVIGLRRDGTAVVIKHRWATDAQVVFG